MASDKRSLVEIHVAVLLFGLAGLFAKLIPLPALEITFWRVLFATIALVAMILILKQSLALQSKIHYFYLVLLGALLAVHWAAFFQSIQVSSVAIGLLSYSTFPIFTTFLEPFVFKEKLRKIDVATAIVVLLGVALMIPSLELGNNVTQGVLWGVLSGAAFAVLSVVNKKYVSQYSSIVITFYQVAVATLLLLPLFLLQVQLQPWQFEARNIFLLAVLGVIFTAFSHMLFIKGMQRVKAQLASLIATLEPVYGIIFAALLLGEIPSIRTIGGAVLILGAIAYSMMKRDN